MRIIGRNADLSGTMQLDFESARIPRATDGVASSVLFNHHFRTI
jgi:hypothetical protein